MMTSVGVPSPQVTVVPAVISPTDPSVSVTVECDFHSVTGIGSQYFGGLHLRGSCSLLREGS